MIEQSIVASTPDGKAEGTLFIPDSNRRYPGILYFTDIAGIRPANLGMARRLAEQQYTVLVPNLFYRTSKLPVFDFPLKFGDERTTKRLSELSSPLTPEAMERDASAYVDFLAASNGVGPEPMGVVGFCFSGSMAMRAAAARPDRIGAVASFHGGRLYTEQPTSPHRELPRIKARLYFGHAVDDKSMPADSISKFEDALKAWGGHYQSETYEGALHGWTVPGGHVYNHTQAERAFERLTQLFAETLK
ncbi:MAG TPA: dienelactone hydrolase family protein [Terriglobales bacterium]|nr:dienelactone hydrolase family protein [Terriglobales bacterium]